MDHNAFRAALPAAVRASLPPEWQGVRHTARHAYVQWYFANPALHYEVWLQSKYQVIEIGLHLEHKQSVMNERIHAYLDRNFIEIRAALGDVWLEKWDKGWHKLYQTRPLTRLDTTTAQQVATDVATQIIVLEPLLRAALSEPQ